MLPPSVVVDAVVFSNLLTLLAVGLTLTYITLKVPNFAHGDFVTVGVYAAFIASCAAGGSLYRWIPLSFAVSGLVALAVYILVMRPLSERGANIVCLMIASIAVSIFIRSVLHILADSLTVRYHVNFRAFLVRDVYYGIRGVKVPGVLIASCAIAVVSLLALHLLLTRTRLGIAMRACVENPALAEVLGIDVNRVYAISWFLAGGLAGLAGALLPLRICSSPEIGWDLLLHIFAATILGGVESIYGAILGGYIIGVAETIGIYLLSLPPLGISTAYKPAIPFAILVLMLLIAPRGLTGTDWGELRLRLTKALRRVGLWT